VITVIGGQILGDRCVRSELVGHGITGTRSIVVADIGAVGVESESVGLSQARASLEWGRNIICVESGSWIEVGVKQGISEGGMRQM